MAFKLEVLRGATSYTICDPGNAAVPFLLDEADLGGAAVRNIEQSGPFQDGSTHLGYRLEPDTFSLRLFVKATSNAILDGYRDTLNKIFKPVDTVPITLKLTRDDGTVRQYDCERAGKLSIPLDKAFRPGFTHKAVVTLRAANPTWYNPTVQEDTFNAPVAEWWLGYATIGSANVMTHVTSPTQGQAMSYSGSVASGSPFTIAFRSALGTPVPLPGIYAFEAIGDVSNTIFAAVSEFGGYAVQSALADMVIAANAGTHNFLVVSQGTALAVYEDGVLASSVPGTTDSIRGTASFVSLGTARWRSDTANTAARRWPPAMPYAAMYNIALNPTQRASLNQALSDAALAGSAFNQTLVYAGDIDTYPIITITGPMTSPIITNAVTGDVLDFTGGTVGSADVWTVDTRYGRKSVVNQAGSSIAHYLSTDSDLATFRVVADPIAPGGTNIITVSSSNAGTAATVQIAYYERYLSY